MFAESQVSETIATGRPTAARIEPLARIAGLAARMFFDGSSRLSLLTQGELRVAATHGPLSEASALAALESRVVADGMLIVIADPSADPRLGPSSAQLGFLVCAPMLESNGAVVGTLTVACGHRPEDLGHVQALMTDLAGVAAAQVEVRRVIGRIDPVSHLPNRRQLVDDLEAMARNPISAGHRWMAVVVDLVHAGNMRDLFRPNDELVSTAARVICEVLGPTTRLYHIGTARFAFLLSAAQPKRWRDLLSTLSATLNRRDWAGGHMTLIDPGLGVAPFRLGMADMRDILQAAIDAAAESRGSHTGWSVCTQRSDQAPRRDFQLLADLRQALREPGQLTLAYQPRQTISTGWCTSAEALLRWSHPTLGRVMPGEIIPLIEKTALPSVLTDWVLNTALAEAARWRVTQPYLRVSVNVSAVNLDQPGFSRRVARSVRKHGLPPSALELEITEGAMLRSSVRARRQLQEIRDLGADIAIDDFGTGYSNLTYLKEVPASVVKLDRFFVRSLATSSRDRTIVRSTIKMAQDLGHRVVAEGVETQDVYDLVAEWGCDEVQGFLICRPLPPHQLAEWLPGHTPTAHARQH